MNNEGEQILSSMEANDVEIKEWGALGSNETCVQVLKHKLIPSTKAFDSAFCDPIA